MVDKLSRADRVSFILDVGCNGSPVMPILKRLGFKNLYGCDLFLKNIDYTLMQVDYSLNRPITDFS
jgi:2-polyprenyl-3-methyl-5-hydroxy-6-metoxy-1,4-benzoquinol methylase